jgi:large subunit ribosomal protein L25
MAEIKLAATKRDFKTKGELKQSRRDGFIPGVYYSKGQEPVNILIKSRDINPFIYTSENHMALLSVDGGPEIRCIVKDVQFAPVTDKIIHFDLYGVTVGEEIEVEVPLHFVGNAIGVKKGGSLQHTMHKVTISCLPKNMPEALEIDVTNLDVNDTITIGDLNFEGIKFTMPEDTMLVTCVAARDEEEEEQETAEAPTEPEVIGKGKSEEEE